MSDVGSCFIFDFYLVMGMSSTTFRRRRNGFLGLGWVYLSSSWRDGAEYLHFDVNRLKNFQIKNCFSSFSLSIQKKQKKFKDKFFAINSGRRSAGNACLASLTIRKGSLPKICQWPMIWSYHWYVFDNGHILIRPADGKKGCLWLGRIYLSSAWSQKKVCTAPAPFCVTLKIDRKPRA